MGKQAGIEGAAVNGYSATDIGMATLVAALLFAGLIQILFGLCKLGKLVRLIPHPVMMGFVNCLAIMIAMGQFLFFQTKTGLDDKEKQFSGLWTAVRLRSCWASLSSPWLLLPPSKAYEGRSCHLGGYSGYFWNQPADSRHQRHSVISWPCSALEGNSDIDSSFPMRTDLSSTVDRKRVYFAILPIAATIAFVGLLESLSPFS